MQVYAPDFSGTSIRSGNSIRHVHGAARDTPPQQMLHRTCHGRAGFPRADDLNAIETVHSVSASSGGQRAPIKLEMTQNRRVRIGRFKCRAKDLESVFTHF